MYIFSSIYEYGALYRPLIRMHCTVSAINSINTLCDHKSIYIQIIYVRLRSQEHMAQTVNYYIERYVYCTAHIEIHNAVAKI